MSNPYLFLDANVTKAEIAKLLEAYPELAEDEQLRMDTLEAETDAFKILEKALDEKHNAEATMEGIGIRMRHLQERAGRFMRKSEAMKALIKAVMQAAKLDKLQLAEATLSITKPRQSVNVTDLEALPQGFYRLKREADKAALKTALEQGETIPGAELRFGDASLMVRTK